MIDKEVRVYRIRNKKTGKFWVAGSKKHKWWREKDCFNAWWRWEDGYFRDQNEYEIAEFKLVEVDKQQEMTNEYYRKKVGLS